MHNEAKPILYFGYLEGGGGKGEGSTTQGACGREVAFTYTACTHVYLHSCYFQTVPCN